MLPLEAILPMGGILGKNRRANILSSLTIQPVRDIFGQGFQFIALQRVSRSFEPKIRVNFERGHFQIKTVETKTELEEVLRLRYDVFHREFMNKKLPIGVDVDRFDSRADHLVIIDKRSDRIVGTYRFISSRDSTSFYSETEFCLYELMNLPGIKLELSRACIHRDYRTGSVMHLLWRGLVEYVQQIGARYLFGLSSIKTTVVSEAAAIYLRLEESGVIARDLHIHPIGNFRIPNFSKEVELARKQNFSGNPENPKDAVPPLFNAYLRAGAKVYGTPALDREFRCIDFLTVLDMENLNQAYGRKYVQ